MKKINLIFLLTIPIFILHGTEEYLNDFSQVYPILNFNWSQKIFTSSQQASFGTFQIMWWAILVVSFLLITFKSTHKFFMFILGVIYLYELTHLISAFSLRKYTPGLASSLLFVPMTFLYWKELLSGRS